MPEEKKYVLKDLSRKILGAGLANKKKIGEVCGSAHGWVVDPKEAHTLIDFTGPMGAASSVYYSLVFQLNKWEFWGLQKADEWIEISPVHAAYFQLTHKQKEELEARIKQGLVSVSQSVADYELLLHDKRKYEEMLHYLGYETKKIQDTEQIDFSADEEDKKKNKKERNVDNHSLKAMFIDQVDLHTGEGISMRSIVQRWPTLISDFMKLTDEDTDVDKVKEKLDVSRAEAVILVTKNKLFNEWKNIFLPEVSGRYKRIMELVKSRETSIREYREWVKPYIARHKLIQEGLASPGNRAYSATAPYVSAGHPMSAHQIVLWTWKDFMPPEFYKIPAELVVKSALEPDDEWTMRNLIFNEDHGLILEHPWITEDWVKKQKEEMYNQRWLIKNKHYYSFFIITFTRAIFRTPQGEEFEDGAFDVNLLFMSQNTMFVKLLELKAKQEEFNRYVDELLGIPYRPPGGSRMEEKKKMKNPVAGAFRKAGLPLQFMKRGPYERDFYDRITKYYLQPIAGDRYGPIVNFIKTKIGYGN